MTARYEGAADEDPTSEAGPYELSFDEGNLHPLINPSATWIPGDRKSRCEPCTFTRCQLEWLLYTWQCVLLVRESHCPCASPNSQWSKASIGTVTKRKCLYTFLKQGYRNKHPQQYRSYWRPGKCHVLQRRSITLNAFLAPYTFARCTYSTLHFLVPS